MTRKEELEKESQRLMAQIVAATWQIVKLKEVRNRDYDDLVKVEARLAVHEGKGE
jgi:hypothetical protein